MAKRFYDIKDIDEETNEETISIVNFKKNGIIQDKIIHIKKTQYKKHIVNFYWNAEKKEVIKGSSKLKQIKDFYSAGESIKYKESTCDIKKRKEIQIGDSVFYYKKLTTDSESFIFGYVTGILGKNEIKSIEICRTSLDRKIDGSIIRLIFNDSTPVFLLSSSYNDRYEETAPLNNKQRVKYKYQLDSLEFYLSQVRLVHIIKTKYRKRDIPLGELSFKDIHKSMFGDIYEWAGSYRKHEVVVGDMNRATAHQDDISHLMKRIFSKTNKTALSRINDIDTLSILLTSLHKDLAWIHPFEDGNGRAIRAYLLILSMSLGIRMDINVFTGEGKRKSQYHYAVRKAIYDGDTKYLHAIIKESLSYFSGNTNSQKS